MSRRVFMGRCLQGLQTRSSEKAILLLIAKRVEIKLPFSNNQHTNGGFMRTRLPLATFLSLALCAAAAIHAQSGNPTTNTPITSNPIPAPIAKTAVKTHGTGIPIACAMTRSCVVARIQMP